MSRTAIILIALLSTACTGFPEKSTSSTGTTGSGGSGGTGDTTTGSVTSVTVGTTVSTGTGMTADFFACDGVEAMHFVLKARVDTMPSGSAIRVGGWIDYPVGTDIGCVNPTGEIGKAEAVLVYYGPVASGTRYITYPGETSANAPAACPGIEDGYYFCPTSTPGQCNSGLELQGCYGPTSAGRLKDGVVSDGLTFTANGAGDLVNPTFTMP